jgi:hypothetical protein
VVKQKGMVFGFRKTATAVVGPEIEEVLKEIKHGETERLQPALSVG